MNLATVATEAAIPVLASALGDPSPRVRAAAVNGLGERGDESTVPVLTARLAGDKDRFVRKTAAYALGRFRSAERTATLIAALRDKDLEVRGAAAVALGDHPDGSAIAALESALSDKNPVVRAQGARALGVNGPAAAQTVPRLISLLTADEDNEVKRHAATALGLVGNRSALAALQRAKQDKDPYLAQAALDAIRAIEEKE